MECLLYTRLYVSLTFTISFNPGPARGSPTMVLILQIRMLRLGESQHLSKALEPVCQAGPAPVLLTGGGSGAGGYQRALRPVRLGLRWPF